VSFDVGVAEDEEAETDGEEVNRIVDLLPSIWVISVVVKIGKVNEVDEMTVVTKVVFVITLLFKEDDDG